MVKWKSRKRWLYPQSQLPNFHHSLWPYSAPGLIFRAAILNQATSGIPSFNVYAFFFFFTEEEYILQRVRIFWKGLFTKMPILYERFICILKQFPLPLTPNLHRVHWFISSLISVWWYTVWTVQDSPCQKAGLPPSIITLPPPCHTGCRVLLFHTFFLSSPSRTLWTQLPRPHSMPCALSVTSHSLTLCSPITATWCFIRCKF